VTDAERGERSGAEAGGIPGEPHVYDREQDTGERERGANAEDGGHRAPVGSVEADQAAPPGDADADEKPAASHHDGGEGRPLDAEPRERADAADEQGIEAHGQDHRGHEQEEGSARVARRAERRLDREEAEHEGPAQEPRIQVVAPQRRDFTRHAHQVKQPVPEREPDE